MRGGGGIRQRAGYSPPVYAADFAPAGTRDPLRASGGNAAAPAELGGCQPVKSAQAYDELICDPMYPKLKQHVVGSTGLAYYEDKDADLAQRIGGRLACLGL